MPEQAKTETPSTKMVKVKIACEDGKHSHAGEPCKKGDIVDVTEQTRDWMREHNIIEGGA